MVISPMEDHRQHTSTPQTWLRPLDFARASGMSKPQVYAELYAGRLHGIQVGRSWYIRAEEIEDYFTRHGQPAA